MTKYLKINVPLKFERERTTPIPKKVPLILQEKKNKLNFEKLHVNST